MLYRQKSKYQSCSFIIFFLISAIILVFCSQTYASELEGEEQPAEQAYELIESGTLEETLAGEDEETSGDTGTAKHFPEVYTLMLLDRTRVDYEEVVNKEDGLFWPFISPRVITMKNRKDYFSTAVKHRYSVCKLMRQRNENRAEALINTMMEVPVKRAEAGGAPALATSAPEQVFSAAMILIPLTDSPDRILAYLFGNWLSILNVDTIVKNFGLRAATSVGIFCDEQDRANDKLAIINQVESEDCRIDDPMNLRVRSRRGLHIFNHFRLNVGDSKVEVVRFKPVFTWGRAYITASDAFQFRPQELEETRLQRLHNTAEEIYKIFKNATSKQIYIPFQPFIDIPVSKELAEILTVELVNNWPKYFRSPKCLKKSWRDLGFAADETVDIVYPHWTYWFRTRDARNKREIFAFRGRRIEQDAIVELKLYNGNLIKILLLRLIRTLPIKFRDKYYWFDRGDWFEISETRIQAMAAELERDKFDYRDPLLLQPYDE
ncbi:MAG: hypothetical protein Q8Q56_02480 [Alphaproteobacteria bacterium]|nr:hypothetical protein [Alphaproteobacteria bacterium]